jgi:hypothetical protein
MATQQQWDSLPPVDEQTPLEHGEIKFNWSGRDRRRVRSGMYAALEDDYTERAIGLRTLTRQKTNVVIKTEEELEAFEKEIAMKGLPSRQRSRIRKEIRRQKNGEEKKQSQRSETYQRRKEETDLDVLMEGVVLPHARKVCAEVWPGGTVDPDEDIDWFWNPQLSWAAGKCYYGRGVPKTYASGDLAIGLAPAYYYQHGTDELLRTVRHELVHAWGYLHPDGETGHGPKFKQWVDDLDTDRYCKHWQK